MAITEPNQSSINTQPFQRARDLSAAVAGRQVKEECRPAMDVWTRDKCGIPQPDCLRAERERQSGERNR